MVATPYQVEDPEATAHKLAEALGGDQDEILAAIADRESGFAYIERKASLDAAERIGELDLAGIAMLPDSRRIYPQGALASQVIGTVGIDNQGLTGLEAHEDELLHGSDGEREVVRDALGERAGAQHDRGCRDGLGPAPHPRRDPAGGDRGGPGRDRQRLSAGRRDGDRDGPA